MGDVVDQDIGEQRPALGRGRHLRDDLGRQAQGLERIVRRREDRELAVPRQGVGHDRVGIQHGRDEAVERPGERAVRVEGDGDVDDRGALRTGLGRGGEGEQRGRDQG